MNADPESWTAPEPRVSATVGMHASASTWVFNVVRELTIDAFGEARVRAIYADGVDEPLIEAARAHRRFVIKSHHGSAELDGWLSAAKARIVLSVRDPRDASISMAQRFDAPLGRTVRWIANDCNRLLRLASQGHSLLRYEDRFFEHPESVGRLAATFGLDPSPTTVERIFARYTTHAVRSFAESLSELPPERIRPVGRRSMDAVTQIHAPHIGDARSGKWRDLPSDSQIQMTHYFKPFLDRMGYLD